MTGTRQFATLTVPGLAVSKDRPRVVNGRTHTPEKTVIYERAVGWLARRSMRARRPTEARVAVSIDLYGFEVTTRQDVDNIAKAILDGMEGVVYVNDRQVDDLHVRRHLGTPDPRAVVVVSELTA